MFSLSSLFSRRGKEREDAQDVEFSVSKKNYADLEEWAKEEGISVEDVLSKSIAMYQVVRHYRTQGLQIASVNDEREVQATLEIPGITTLESDPFAAKPSETRSTRFMAQHGEPQEPENPQSSDAKIINTQKGLTTAMPW